MIHMEAGNFYRRRDGVVVGPAKKNPSAIFLGFFYHCGGEEYDQNGNWDLVCYIENGLDLIEEVPAPVTTVPASEMKTSETCETCKFWDKTSVDWITNRIEFGLCKAIKHLEIIQDEISLSDFEGESEEYYAARNSNVKSKKAYVEDASGYHAELNTDADFGCVLYEESNQRMSLKKKVKIAHFRNLFRYYNYAIHLGQESMVCPMYSLSHPPT